MNLGWPRTLLGQNTLLLVATILLSQMAAVLVIFVFVQSPRVKDSAALAASQIMTIERVLSMAPESDRDKYVKLLDGREALPPVVARDDASAGAQGPRHSEMQFFLEELSARLPPAIALNVRVGPNPSLWVYVHIGAQPYWIPLPIEHTVRFRSAWIALAVSSLLSAIAVLIAYLTHRRINQPLRQLVAAADRLSRGEQPEPVCLAGPEEIVRVSATFNRMALALADIDATRSLMLATISHDIRTPLTNLRLAMAMPELLEVPHLSTERFIDDIDAIVQQFIDYARGGDGEDFCDADLNALIDQLAADFTGLGLPFSLELGELPLVSMRPVSMLRLLVNLMRNAALYGRVGLEVRSWAEHGSVSVVVADRGPGVDAALLKLLKQPYRRGEHVSQPGAGSGLGLAIAERIAQQHGGSLELSLRREGGFQAHLRLPLSTQSPSSALSVATAAPRLRERTASGISRQNG